MSNEYEARLTSPRVPRALCANTEVLTIILDHGLLS